MLYPLLPLVAFALVAALDGLTAATDPSSIPVLGALDEPAHLATAWLLLAAFLPARAGALRVWALVGAVAIDLDHIPLYAWHVLAAGPDSRPVTHSLLTVAVLAAAGALAPARLRTPLLGLALGVCLHFVRDLAEGPGVPLFWPIDSTNVIAPYGGYLLVLAVVAAGAAARHWRSGRRVVSPPRPGTRPAPSPPASARPPVDGSRPSRRG